MKKNYIELFVGIVVVFFVIVYFMDYTANNTYYIIRNPITYREPFTMTARTQEEVGDSYNNSTPNQPYALLNGVLPVKEGQVKGPLNSQTCYDHDFQTRLEKTGNYIQRTNNYKRADPESCTSPFQEFVTAFYKVEPLD